MCASKTISLFDTDEYSIRLEYNKDYVIVHLPELNTFNKSVFLDMKFRLEDWYNFFTTAGYAGIFAAVDPNNHKVQKLLKRLGFKLKGFADNMNVYFYGEQ